MITSAWLIASLSSVSLITLSNVWWLRRVPHHVLGNTIVTTSTVL